MPRDPLIHGQKADFGTIYDQPDPREYFRTLSSLDYQIPQQAMPVFDAIIDALPDTVRSTVVDVCCSYGINAALLRHELDLSDLTAHYTAPDLAAASTDEVRQADREFFAERVQHPDLAVLGLDAAQPAIDYAVSANLLEQGWAENLENAAPSPELAEGISDADLIISTGGVGYVGPNTFAKLLDCVDDPANLWLVTFVLRVFDYSEITELLAEYGLITEQLPGVTFPQRRFATPDEQKAAVHDVVSRDLDPSDKEADGWFHASCFLTRPAAATDVPVMKFVPGMS